MHRNQELYHFLLGKAEQLTEDWFNSLDKVNLGGVYSATDPEVIKTLKRQNYEFHLHLCKVFVEDEQSFFKDFEKWIYTVSRDSQHLNTPVHSIISEFMRVRTQYLDFIDQFAEMKKDVYEPERVRAWINVIIRAFDQVIIQTTEETYNYSTELLRAQQEMIYELSSPVIKLDNNRALLPLVGDIDTARAKLVLENTLEQCAEKGVTRLFIDLSGVVMVDTMVAHQIFQLIEALNLIGVKSTLSGIRPEIASTAVQLGLSFENISIESNLSRALTANRG
ncbi:STAS domain-containing protein [Heyndrickxia acidicola]|uniref:STAS domain-containing protein n=1 Tax=Heyndrickxia acidicola TaxID=209389 RepID=A0ABU6MIW1_9BACI|nr:STAS domain-containing protein [Heyndrickxia acidicola]MED1204593.1 STAS domain-containing protein [Heyndrickxia acidicola]